MNNNNNPHPQTSSYHGYQHPLVIPARIAPDPADQIPLIPCAIRAADLPHERAIPVQAHDAVDQQLVLGAGALHARLQQGGVEHGAVGTAAHHAHERVFHVAREFLLHDGVEGDAVFVFVGEGDGADLAIAAVGENGADGQLLGANFGLGGAVELRYVRVNVLRQHGSRVFLPRAGYDHHVHTFRLPAEVAAHVRVQAAVVRLLVGLLDGGHIGVATPDEHVVEQGFFGSYALERFVEAPYIMLERAAQNGHKG